LENGGSIDGYSMDFGIPSATLARKYEECKDKEHKHIHQKKKYIFERRATFFYNSEEQQTYWIYIGSP
jgi:hypothetical protein